MNATFARPGAGASPVVDRVRNGLPTFGVVFNFPTMGKRVEGERRAT